MNARYVAITQRVVNASNRPEIGDYLDARWATTLDTLGLRPLPLPNHAPSVREMLSDIPVSLLILSGGNDLASLSNPNDAFPHRDEVERYAIALATAHEIPILGVCRGAQLLLREMGVDPVRQSGHAGTVHSIRTVSRTPWRWPLEFSVTSHHDWVIRQESLPPSIEVLAEADDGTVEAFRHLDERRWGMMWHPEREQPAAHGVRALKYLAGVA